MLKYVEKVAAASDDLCPTSGVYWSSGCEHADARSFEVGEVLPWCGMCGRNVRWLMYRPGTVPANVMSTGRDFYDALRRSLLFED